jgi:serine/threonine protein kinase/uncharacterized caspase-like protein
MQKLALIAGISKYASRWPQLSYCTHDADQISETLSFPEYGFSTTVITDENVTKSFILRWLLEARNSGAEKILFYFAGHGVVNDLGSFLVTYDNDELEEGLPLTDLLRIAEPKNGSDTEVVIILDCCHSGHAATPDQSSIASRKISNNDVTQVARETDPSSVIIAACGGEQKALETANFGHGVFTYHLLNSLLGDAADHRGDVTIHSIYEVVSREMEGSSHKQEPVFGGRVQGRFVLGTGFTPALSPPRPEQEYARIEREAQHHLEQYNKIRTTDSSNWRTEGYALACKKLENISSWFMKKESIEGLSQREDFKRSKETLLRYQSELGVVEQGTNTRWGNLERPIGAGGFGKVWLVRQSDNRKLAYKLYHANELSDREKVKRFKNGYDAMRMLNDPRIVNVHDYSDCPPGFVMDYIDGENLRELAIGTFMEPAEIIQILLASAEAIEHAHLNEVIHRDIKPENIICKYGKDGVYRPYLTDFDLAWFSTQTQKATKTAMGVVYYAAPEQYVAFNPKAARSRTATLDVYSFGQLLYFCFTNSDPEPLDIERNCQTLNRKLKDSCSVTAARSLISLYRNCVQFSPGDRIQNFTFIISTLGMIIQELSHTDDQEIDLAAYLDELHFRVTTIVPEAPVTSFSNMANTWEMSPEWREHTHTRKGIGGFLVIHFKPLSRVSLENVSNERMRDLLNRRVDDALTSYGNRAQRRPGQKGEFEFFLEWKPKSLTRADALELSEALKKVLGNLQR